MDRMVSPTQPCCNWMRLSIRLTQSHVQRSLLAISKAAGTQSRPLT